MFRAFESFQRGAEGCAGEVSLGSVDFSSPGLSFPAWCLSWKLHTEQDQFVLHWLVVSCGWSRASPRCGQQQPLEPLSPRLSRGWNSCLGCFCRHGSRDTEGNGWCFSADFWNSSQFGIHVIV